MFKSASAHFPWELIHSLVAVYLCNKTDGWFGFVVTNWSTRNQSWQGGSFYSVLIWANPVLCEIAYFNPITFAILVCCVAFMILWCRQKRTGRYFGHCTCEIHTQMALMSDSWPVKVCLHMPSLISQSLAEASQAPETNKRASGARDRDITSPVWPANVVVCCPVSMSQRALQM